MHRSNPDYDREAEAIRAQLPKCHRCAVIGSASFWGRDSAEICRAVGRDLARFDDMALITGGVPGAGETVGRSFFSERESLGVPANVYHVLPRGASAWDYGLTLFGGDSMGERREILARLARVYVAIEGGPGTEHEATVAAQQGAAVIPVGRSGGASRDIHARHQSPVTGLEAKWQSLGDTSIDIQRIASSVCLLVKAVAHRTEP